MLIEEQILNIVKSIPSGMVTSYGAIAKQIGMKSSARFVGYVLRHNGGDMEIPFHRVVNRNGELTAKHHFPTPTMMKELLIGEGVEFKGERVDLKKHFWQVGN